MALSFVVPTVSVDCTFFVLELRSFFSLPGNEKIKGLDWWFATHQSDEKSYLSLVGDKF